MSGEQHSLQTYVSDMLALEHHILIPIVKQCEDDDFLKYANAKSLIEDIRVSTEAHIKGLDACLERLGGHEASPTKSAVAGIEGFFAAAIDMMRKTKVSKALRDDYTALSLCCAGYTMLQTTALAMRDHAAASLAAEHLRDYAQCVMQIGSSLPEVVLQELRDIGLDVDPAMAQPARSAAESAWRSSAQTVHTGETGTTEATRRSTM